MSHSAHIVGLDDLAAMVPDGARICIPADYSGVAMATTLALIRRGVRGLHLVSVPATGLQADLLIGAGCVATMETAGVTLGEYGGAPRFNDAVRKGSIKVLDATCPAIHAALQASEKGVPFGTLRGIIGSDLLNSRPDWAVIDNPFLAGDKIVALPAIRADFAMFHAPMADSEGNVWIGRRREQLTMAHASASSIITVEEVRDGNFLEDDQLAAGTIPSIYVGAIAEAKHGARPLAMWGQYAIDDAFMREYVELARTEAGFARILDRLMGGQKAAAE
jgi:glutaconate CoA-transferase subunit A